MEASRTEIFHFLMSENLSSLLVKPMTKFIIDNKILPLDRILTKCAAQITFRDMISLIFHASRIMSAKSNDPNNTEWNNLHKKFEHEINCQDCEHWPILQLRFSEFEKCIEIQNLNGKFLETDNFLTLLAYILYIEGYKRSMYQTHGYVKILTAKVSSRLSKSQSDISVSKMSISFLLWMLKLFIDLYLEIYARHSSIEFKIGQAIQKQFLGVQLL